MNKPTPDSEIHLSESPRGTSRSQIESESQPLSSSIKHMMIMLAVNSNEAETILEETLEKLKKSNFNVLLESIDEKYNKGICENSQPTAEDKLIKLVYEKIYDSLVTANLLRTEMESRRATEMWPTSDVHYEKSLLVSNNKPSMSGLIWKSKINLEKSENRPLRKKSIDSSKSGDLIDSVPFFQSVVSQNAFLQFYQENKSAIMQKSALRNQGDENQNGVSKKTALLFNQVANEIINKIVQSRLASNTEDIDIRELSAGLGAQACDRTTRSSVLVNCIKNMSDARRQLDVQLELDFDKYLNLQTQNLMELNLNNVDLVNESTTNQIPTLKKPSEQNADNQIGFLPTFAKLENEVEGFHTIESDEVRTARLGTSFCDSNEFTYSELQKLCCLFYRKLAKYPEETSGLKKLSEKTQMSNILKRLEGVDETGFFKD